MVGLSSDTHTARGGPPPLNMATHPTRGNAARSAESSVVNPSSRGVVWVESDLEDDILSSAGPGLEMEMDEVDAVAVALDHCSLTSGLKANRMGGAGLQPPQSTGHQSVGSHSVNISQSSKWYSKSARRTAAIDRPVSERRVILDGRADRSESVSGHSAEHASPNIAHTNHPAIVQQLQPVQQPQPLPQPQVNQTDIYLSGSSKEKYYSVIVGRKTGVFNDWNEVNALVSGISCYSQQSFKTREAALHNYYTAKRAGRVKVRRMPGNTEERWGPLSEAEL